MVVLLIILAIIILILIVPFGAAVSYEGGELYAAIRVFCFNLRILPKKDKPEKEKKPKKEKPKKPKKEKKKKKKEEEPAEGGEKQKKKLPFSLSQIPELLKIVLDVLSGFRRKLTVNYFKLHLLVGTDDPYSTAVMYGAICTVLGMLESKQGTAFNVVKSDVAVAPDFNSEEMSADAAITLTISLGRILAVVLAAAWRVLKLIIKNKKSQRSDGAEERTDKDGTDAESKSDDGIPSGQLG